MKRTLSFSLVGLHFMCKMNVINSSGHEPIIKDFTLPLTLSYKEEKQMTHTFQLIEAMVSIDATK